MLAVTRTQFTQLYATKYNDDNYDIHIRLTQNDINYRNVSNTITYIKIKTNEDNCTEICDKKTKLVKGANKQNIQKPTTYKHENAYLEINIEKRQNSTIK